MAKILKVVVISFALVLVLALAACGAAVGAYFYLQQPPKPNAAPEVAEGAGGAEEGAAEAEGGQNASASATESSAEKAEAEYVLKVPKGTSVKDVAAELEAAQMIRSADVFYLKARIEKLGMKAGRYVVRSGMNMAQIFELLQTGQQEHISVSIPEGLTLSQIAALLEKSDVILSAEEFVAECRSREILDKYNIPAPSAEGYLFPDTYFFTPSMPCGEVIERLIDNCFARLESLEIPADDAQQLHDTIILASIVEREYRRPEEAPLIASVFTNRLKRHIGLESCATIVYILTEIEGRPHPERITYEDLKIDSVYNTYKWAGLPAGPISNPGAVALSAAARPAKTDYFYFRVADEAAGSHYFSSTLEEHAAAGRSLSVKKAAGK